MGAMKRRASAEGGRARKLIKFSFGGFLNACLIFCAAGASLFVVSQLSARLSNKLAAICFGLSWGLSVFLLFGQRVTSSNEIRKKLGTPGNEVEIAMPVCAASLWVPIFFGMFCYQLQVAQIVHFNGVQASGFLPWIGFGYESVLDHLLFDIPSTFDLRITNVAPDSIGTRLLLASHRLIGSIFVIETIWRCFRLTRNRPSEEA